MSKAPFLSFSQAAIIAKALFVLLKPSPRWLSLLQGESATLPSGAGAVVTDNSVPEGHKGLHGFLYGDGGAEVHDGADRQYQSREVHATLMLVVSLSRCMLPYRHLICYSSCSRSCVAKYLAAAIHTLRCTTSMMCCTAASYTAAIEGGAAKTSGAVTSRTTCG